MKKILSTFFSIFWGGVLAQFKKRGGIWSEQIFLKVSFLNKNWNNFTMHYVIDFKMDYEDSLYELGYCDVNFIYVFLHPEELFNSN